MDLEIRDSQYGFSGDKDKKKPEIIKYDNKFYIEEPSLTKWFEKDLGDDWWGNRHLSGRRLMFKDYAHMDGFEIKTYDAGEFILDMNFVVLCKEYKNLKKRKI